jgi:hypothetical protein
MDMKKNTSPVRAPEISTSARATIRLHISELALNGFAAGDRHLIGDAVELELARMLATQDMPSKFATDGQMGHLDGGSFNIAPNASGETVGRQIAQAVYESLQS